jgi:hypothetical protein
MDKYEYLDLIVHNDMWGIIYQRFMELTEGRSDIDQIFLQTYMMKVTEVIGTKSLMQLYQDCKDYYNNKFELTYITHRGELIIAGSSGDFLISQPVLGEVPIYTFE